MILGAGETSELTARALAEQGAGTIFVANRHADRALSLAQRFGGSVVGLDGLPEQLTRADIVLSSTSSPHPIVGREELEQVMRRARRAPAAADRHRRPARRRPGLRRAGGREPVRHRRPAGGRRAQPRHARASEVPRAQEIVEEEIHRFARWLGQLDALPTISALREHGSALVEQVLAENDGRWESASPRDLARVEAIARAVMSRLLHEPTIRLRVSTAKPGVTRASSSCASCSGCATMSPTRRRAPPGPRRTPADAGQRALAPAPLKRERLGLLTLAL